MKYNVIDVNSKLNEAHVIIVLPSQVEKLREYEMSRAKKTKKVPYSCLKVLLMVESNDKFINKDFDEHKLLIW